MTTTPFDPIFRDSCVNIHKANCSVNTRLIDPCSCLKYYRCVNNGMVPQECSPGTAYDHTVGTSSSTYCIKDTDIYLQNKCSPTNPWTRCKDTSGLTDTQLIQIQERCTGTKVTTPVPPGDNGSNTGVIVGALIGGIVVISVIVIGFILYKRGYTPSVSIKKKGKKSKYPLDYQPSINNPQYFGGQTDTNIYEEYSTIDDAMHDPNYSHSAPNLPSRPPSTNSTNSNPTGTGDRKISVSSVQSYMEPSPSQKYGFDNRAFSSVEEEHPTNNNAIDDRYYTEILPDLPSNGHINSHNRTDDISPYDNSLHV